MSKKILDDQEKVYERLNTVLILIFFMSMTPILELATRIRFNKEIQHLEGRIDT